MPKAILISYIFLLPLIAVSQSASFTYQSGASGLCSPSTIQFTQTSTGNPTGFIWDFGNNTKGYEDNELVTYSSPGSYNVKLITFYDQTFSETIQTIVVNPAVQVVLTADRSTICTPGIINFTVAGAPATASYTWDFGDTTGTVTTAINQTPHDYVGFGSFKVTVAVTDITGCVGFATKIVNITKPKIVATASPLSGCIPSDVNFRSTISVPVNDVVTNYTWDFGDGSPVSSTPTNNNILHRYSTVGSYLPTLTITTRDGCTNTYNYPALAYGTPPFNHIAYPKKAVICGSETLVLVAKAADANTYQWNYGDGSSASVTDTITRHKYASLGIKKVSVTPYFNGCRGVTIRFDIEVIGVIAKYNYANTCTDRKTYSFTNTSLGNLSASLWDFGDGSAGVTTNDATHNFPVSGQFPTSLTVTDAITGCADTIIQTIFTAEPILVNPDSAVCRNDTTRFSIINNYTTSTATYTWNIVGTKIGPGKNPSIKVKAGTLGNFPNFVSIDYGPQSCRDTVLLDHLILIKGPDLNFNAPTNICFKSPVTVTNNSKPFIPGDSIPLWYWNFGNSVINDTIYQPLTFQYKNRGRYNIKLVAIDINGCKDSLTKIISVNPNPFLRVLPRLDTMCLGQPVTLVAFSSNNILWSPVASLSCSTCDTVIANPSVTTQYYVTATTPLNCTARDSVTVKVFAPFVATTPSSKLYICRNEQVQLDIQPKINKIVWSPATGLSNSTIYNPVASPQQTTTYTATITDSVGCFSSIVDISVIVKSLPTVNAGPDKIVPYNSPFTITPVYSNNVRLYEWAPTTLLYCTNCSIPGGTALYSETYTVKVTSDSGCVATDSISIFIECKEANILMPKAFTPNNDNLNDFYYPLTRGIKSITKFIIYNRQGQVMYEAGNFPPNSRSFAWKGEYKGQLQPAAGYIYSLEALCELGLKITKSGSFLLLR